jgi:diguanylate cyclase (GGDEF)-like protein/PAS domain S-box-containing protein
MSWLHHFFLIGPIPADAMYGHYDLSLVLLSYLVASAASYVALDMSPHLRKPTTFLFRICWIIGGAFVMGSGIWSMHFIGMLAFSMDMDMPMSYSLFWTGLSMIVAVVTAAVAFLLFATKNPQTKHYVISGIILGIAIPTIHYTGMAGMEGVTIHYQPALFSLSVLVAIIAATAALWLSVQSDKGSFVKRARLKLVSALIMGFAIVGMHYVGMYAAVFTPGIMVHSAFIDPSHLATVIATTVLSILTIALIISTAKYLIDTKLKNKNYFLEAILNNMGDGVIACDAKGKLTLFNHTVDKMYGSMITTKMLLGEWTSTLSFFKSNFDHELKLVENPLYQALQGEEVRDVEVISRDRRGDVHTLLIDGQRLRGTENETLGAVIVFSDISEIKTDEEKLKHQATHDVLTDLPNRALLLDRLNQAIVAARRDNLQVTVIFIDLDFFKFINDALGHSFGDRLLKLVASRFKTLLRASDTLSRLGGDEFVIVLPDQENINNVPTLLERILKSISEPYKLDKHEINITCSMGFSVFPENGEDAETLLKNADNAMYQAKESGRNTFQFYTGEMNTLVTKRLEVENGLRHALVENEFIVDYQPKLDIKTNELVGLEALVRWNHPEQGIIPPSDFIPIAEDTGLIIALGKWVLKTACAQNKAWQDQGFPPLCVSVNLSARQCREKGLFDIIKNILEETGLEPQYLELELTETLAMSDPVEFIEMLTKFRELDIKTSIDDFGTGYSSLNYLRQFPVNCLKIDQSFIRELQTKDDDLSILKAIISLGHSLNMRVIAEGVETKLQLSQLQDNDCDEIQGFYLSRPISPASMSDFMREYNNKK